MEDANLGKTISVKRGHAILCSGGEGFASSRNMQFYWLPSCVFNGAGLFLQLRHIWSFWSAVNPLVRDKNKCCLLPVFSWPRWTGEFSVAGIRLPNSNNSHFMLSNPRYCHSDLAQTRLLEFCCQDCYSFTKRPFCGPMESCVRIGRHCC